MKRLLKWFILIILLLALLLALLPIAAKHWLVHDLSQQGYEAHIDTFSFNPFTGKLKLKDVDIRENHKPITQITLLEGRLKLSQLLQRAVVLKKVKAHGIKVEVDAHSSSSHGKASSTRSFLNKYAASWQLGVVSGLVEQVEFCRVGLLAPDSINGSTDKVSASGEVSQCLTMGSLSLRDIVIDKAAANNGENTAQAGWQFSSTGMLHFHNLYLRDKEHDKALLHLASAEIRGLTWQAGIQSADLVVVDGLHLFERSEEAGAQQNMPYHTQFDQLRVDAVNLSRSGAQTTHVAMESLVITAWQQALTKLPEGHFEQERLMGKYFPALSRTLGLLDNNAAFEWKTNRLQVLEGKVAWLDESVSPPAQAILAGLSADFGPIDTQSDKTKTPISLSARLGESDAQGRDIEIQGHWTLFSPSLNASLKGKVAGLDLEKVLPYTQDFLSENAIRGRVDSAFDFVAKQGNVIGSGSVRFSDLVTQGGYRSGGRLMFRESFSRLKEVNGSVDMPLTYTFKAHDITALIKGFSAEAKYTMSERAQGREPRREYVAPKPLLREALKYNPNTLELLGAQFTHLKAIIKQAQQHPQKTLYLCPITTGGEWSQLYNQGRKKALSQSVSESEKQVLQSLSGSRADYITAYIEGQGVVGLNYRLCQSKIDLDVIGPSYLSAELR